MNCFKNYFLKQIMSVSVFILVLSAAWSARCSVAPPNGVNILFLSTAQEITEKAKVSFSVDAASGLIHAGCNFPQYTEPVDIFVGFTSPGRNFYYPDSSDVLTAAAGGFKSYATSVTTALVKNFNTGNMNLAAGEWWVNWIVKPSGNDWSNYEFGGYKVVVGNGVTIGTISGDAGVCYSTTDYSDCMLQCTTPECYMNCVTNGGFVNLAISLINDTSNNIEFTFTAGMMLIPDSSDTQTMMVLIDKTVSVPPGTTPFCVPTFCLNASLSAPEDSDIFHAGGQISRQCLIQIINLTRGKTIMEPIKVQNIIWNCLDDETGVSDDEWDYLTNLQ